MEEKMICLCVYADSTGLFSEQECDYDNLVDMYFPEWVVRKWYDDEPMLAEYTAEELDIPLSEVTFKDWADKISTADDTDGLYLFAKENGVTPTFGVDGTHYVFWRDDDNFKSIVFEGSYDKCREFMKENNFIWRDEYELEVN